MYTASYEDGITGRIVTKCSSEPSMLIDLVRRSSSDGRCVIMTPDGREVWYPYQSL